MSSSVFQNEQGQPVGAPVPDWQPCPAPSKQLMEGRQCWLEPLQPSLHGEDLYRAFAADSEGHNWTYLPYGPFQGQADFQQWLEASCQGYDPQFYAVMDRRSGEAVGMASFLRIDRANGVIEVGHIHFSPRLQRTAMATETMYLMMHQVFEGLGYRRYEWKCDDLNGPSRRAAERLGFQYEGRFRQAVVYKGRNRDTAWYSIIDSDWPRLQQGFLQWLASDNFDADGRQKRSLQQCMETGK